MAAIFNDAYLEANRKRIIELEKELRKVELTKKRKKKSKKKRKGT